MDALQGKVAIVTGGKSGIGQAVARRFAAEGCHVVVADWAQAGTVDASPPDPGGLTTFDRVDVSDHLQVRDFIAKAVADLGRVDILFNAAAIYPICPGLLGVDEPIWDDVLNINLKGCFLMCREVIPHIIKYGSGCIVTVSSIAALRGTNYCVPYAAAKAGVIQLTKAIAVEFGAAGLRCNCIVPGLIDTPMSRRATSTEEEFLRRSQQIPVGRVGKPDDIAELAMFLVSDGASFINGEAITIDGGAMAR